jgi:hypothetical protein
VGVAGAVGVDLAAGCIGSVSRDTISLDLLHLGEYNVLYLSAVRYTPPSAAPREGLPVVMQSSMNISNAVRCSTTLGNGLCPTGPSRNQNKDD